MKLKKKIKRKKIKTHRKHGKITTFKMLKRKLNTPNIIFLNLTLRL